MFYVVYVWLLWSPDNHLPRDTLILADPELFSCQKGCIYPSSTKLLILSLGLSQSPCEKIKNKNQPLLSRILYTWTWLNSCDFRWDLKGRWTGELDTIFYELSSFFATADWSNSHVTVDEALTWSSQCKQNALWCFYLVYCSDIDSQKEAQQKFCHRSNAKFNFQNWNPTAVKSSFFPPFLLNGPNLLMTKNNQINNMNVLYSAISNSTGAHDFN